MYKPIFAISGLHLDKRSGRGFPMRFLIPFVMRNAAARESANPSHPVCHSHSFLFHIRVFGVDFETVGPGTRRMATRNMMAAGMTRPQTMRTAKETFSFRT